MKSRKLIEKYLTECLQIQVCLRKLAKSKMDKLPLLITGAFDMAEGEIFGRNVLFAIDMTGTYAPAQLRKLGNLIADKLDENVVFVFDQVTGYNQSRLIQHGVNFIVPKKMMFMPELLIDIRPIRIAFNQDSNMPITAQLIVLYHLECTKIEAMAISDIAREMMVSYATCNKSLTWLRGHEFATETKVGKRKLITLPTDKWSFWKSVLPYLTSPVERILYTETEVHYMSGYNALAEYSRLAHTAERVCAWSSHIPPSFTKEQNDVKIEVWRYEPEVLSRTGVVDPLSLYLTLKDDEDERVCMELDYMLHKVLDEDGRTE